MNIKITIEEFLAFILDDKVVEDDLSKLITMLDKLAYSVGISNYEFDDTEYPDSPEKSYSSIRIIVQKRFPTLGYYNVVRDVSDGSSTVL